MSEAMDYLVGAVLIGAGATAVMDIWAVARKRMLGIPALDYGLVGRWLAHLTRGRFRHDPIAASPPVRGERLIGWIAHYLTGIAFAATLLALWGLDWARHPTLGPALIVGIGSVATPFLVMQPGMGAGIAASRTPRPAAARLHSLVTHGMSALAFTAPAGLRVCLARFNDSAIVSGSRHPGPSLPAWPASALSGEWPSWRPVAYRFAGQPFANPLLIFDQNMGVDCPDDHQHAEGCQQCDEPEPLPDCANFYSEIE